MSAQGNTGQQFQHEYDKAIERIRTMPDGVVGWVIRFLQTDLEALTPTEWTLVAFEVASFVDDATHRYGGLMGIESGWSVEGVPEATIFQTIPSRKEALEIQAKVLGQLERYWKEHHAVFTFPQLTLIVTPSGAPGAHKSEIVVVARRKAKEFEYRFAHLLAESGEYIRRCPECATIYLAIRCDQVYCHPRCQNRVASRKWREGRKTNRTTERRKEDRRGKKSGKG